MEAVDELPVEAGLLEAGPVEAGLLEAGPVEAELLEARLVEARPEKPAGHLDVLTVVDPLVDWEGQVSL